jgi:hypothetical protein
MTSKLQLAKRIASLVVYGHVLLFVYGLMVMLVSGYDRVDTFQMILMGSPLLAVIALSAFRFMAALPTNDTSETADQSWVAMSTIVTALFLFALFATYSMAMFNTSADSSTLKIIVGAIETVFGGYLGVNRDTLFPDKTQD